MSHTRPEDLVAALARRLGPHVNRFAEYAAGELWQRARRTARDEGLTEPESDAVAALCVQQATKALAGGIEQVRRERLFRKL